MCPLAMRRAWHLVTRRLLSARGAVTNRVLLGESQVSEEAVGSEARGRWLTASAPFPQDKHALAMAIHVGGPEATPPASHHWARTVLTGNVVEKAYKHTIFSERGKKGPSCSTSIAFVSVGQLSRPRADHSRRRSSLDGRTNWRRGVEYPLCPGAQWVKRRRGACRAGQRGLSTPVCAE